MKRTLALLLVFVMLFAFAACGDTTDESNSESVTSAAEANQSLEDTEKPENDEILAEVKNNDGETEQLSAKDLVSFDNENSVKFKKKYYEATVTVISEVEKVHGETYYNGHHMAAYIELKGGWTVEASSGSIVEDLSAGDKVSCTGNIWSVDGTDYFPHVELFIINGHSTTIKKNNGD